MPERQTRKPLASINITPLVDVLLILVAALLLLTPYFVKPLPVELPKTSLEGQPLPLKPMLLGLDESGQLWLDSTPTELNLVLEQIQEGVTSVEIAAGKNVRYEAIVNLVEAVRKRNPREISLLTS